jgi:lycopene cyclase domain-containing protein
MYTYLLINIVVLSSALVVQWLKIIPSWRVNRAIITSAIVSIPFIAWDAIFMINGVWGFNKEYLLGINLLKLPVEEIVFFITIPTASLLIYEVIAYKDFRLKSDRATKLVNTLLAIILILLTSYAVLNGLVYTSTVGSLSLAILVYSYHKSRDILPYFYVAYLITLIPFLLTNGILTSGIDFISPKPIVWYNNNYNLEARFLTIPLEDFIYTYLLLLTNVLVYNKINRK